MGTGIYAQYGIEPARKVVAGKTLQVLRITDPWKEVSEEISNAVHMPPEQATQKFEAMGWSRKGKRWRAPPPPKPAAVTAPPRQEKETITMPRPEAAPPRTTPPPAAHNATADSPTPKLVRQVMALLEAHFDEETGIWRNGYSDARIARETEASVEMVAGTRRAAFGEERDIAELQAMKTEIGVLRGMVEDLESRIASALNPAGKR